ncbi:MAG: hypothetical protein AB7F99_05235 [Vicinamibacterales bacterium]
MAENFDKTFDKARRDPESAPIKPVDDPRYIDPNKRAGTAWPDPETERAQPGDVLGIERGGESTNLGDTAEDEDKRRHDAEKAARKG